MIENSMVIGPYYDEGPIPGLGGRDNREYDSLRDEPTDEDLEDGE